MTFWKHSKKNVQPRAIGGEIIQPEPTPPPKPVHKIDESPGFCYQIKKDKELNRLGITDKASCEYTFSPFDQVVGCYYRDTSTQNAKDICYDFYGASHRAIMFNGEDTGFCFALRTNTDNACVVKLDENRVASTEPIFEIPKDVVENMVKKYSDK